MESLLYIGLRTIIMFFILFLIFRVMGKREIGELSVLDLVIFMMIAETGVVAIVDLEISMFEALVPMVLLLGIQITIAFISLKSKKLREILEGKPTIIIHNGKIDERAMKKERYNFDDLLQQLRARDVFDLNEVEFAILETSGDLTVMKKSKQLDEAQVTFPLPLILDGEIQPRHLQQINQTNDWLLEQLRERGYDSVHDISFCMIHNGKFYIDEKDY
ncbi:DUF421 domain-containing protein [Bacillus massiliigorillae]|uniref:DUF421 domain-containing protein n=1 Tax=Bacillus massiliigorillae TaxID=1243664 RepID=UPI00039CA2C4|nr:DUF421 domain-containing protein [Bacillus massiliigorillae]